jgi:hypothetical protein
MSKLAVLRKIAVSNQPRDRTGRWVKIAVASTGKVVGSKVGMVVAGPNGALVGSLVGAIATRKAMADATATYTAHQQLKHDRAYASLSRLEKLKALREKAIAELEAKKAQTEDEILSDVAGWAVGNASSEAINAAVSALAPVPGKGAITAFATVPKLMKLKERLANAKR